MIDHDILMISRDPLLGDTSSPVFMRHKEYALYTRSLTVIVCAESGIRTPIIYKNLRIYPWVYLVREFVKPSLNYTYITAQDPLYAGLCALFFSWRTRARLQLQVHGDYLGNAYWLAHSFTNRVWQRIALFILSRADVIRVVSMRLRTHLISLGVSPSVIKVLPLFSPIPEVSTRTTKETIILYTGRFTWEKNLGWLLRAWSSIQDTHHDWKLVMVGKGPEEKKLRSYAESLGIENRIEWHPWHHDVSSWYEKASLVVLPSFFEGWGRSIIEGMMCRCVVVMSDVGIAGEVVRNQENGIVVDSSNEESLPIALSILINDKEYRDALGMMAEQSVRRHDDETSYISKWEELFV